MIDIVLIEIENEGNLGAVSRVMANFDFKNLVLVRPKCDERSLEVIKRAKHSKDVLKSIKVIDKMPKYDYVIATTAKLGTDYNIPRSPISPEQLREKLSEIDTGKLKIALLIGREGDGLTNEEIMAADFVVTIPASKEYPTLNISHALGIILYELSKGKNNVTSHIIFATDKEKKIIRALIEDILDKTDFNTEEKKNTQRLIWRRMIGKSFLTKREAFALIGFLKRIKK